MTESHQIILGVDEAGRGPLAGPVVAAGVILDDLRPIAGLNDSKKLSEKARFGLFEEIKKSALFFAVSEIDAAAIDEINILQATFMAMRKVVLDACRKLPVDLVMVDGSMIVPGLPQVKQTAVIKGDTKFESIMAASIVAKCHRDLLMAKYHDRYPQYGFNKHKGYGTKGHMDAILNLGACPIHRKSFAPIKDLDRG